MAEPTTVQALIIQPDGTWEKRSLPTGYPDFSQSFLGEGYLELLQPTSRIAFWFDEEGKFKGLEPNHAATRLFHALGVKRLAPDDVIGGTVAVTGSDGEFTSDCPEDVFQVFLSNFKI